jgi:ferritin-like metal-binding protein YciE
MKFPSLDELFLHELKDLYDAEHQLTQALPKMAEAANDPELKDAFERHLQETTAQVARLEEVFAECGETPEREDCAGMKGLIKEGEKMMKAEAEPSVMDAALIAAAQRVEHYEIAAYGTLIAWADEAGFSSALELLEQSLEEEKAADRKLSAIATSGVNAEADEEENGATPARKTASRTTSGSRTRKSAPARSRRAKR